MDDGGGATTTSMRNSRRIAVLVVLAVLAAGTGVLVLRWGGDQPAGPAAAAQAAPVGSAPAPVAKTSPTPSDAVEAVLAAQSAALLRGDERGWLAAVDPARPKLLARYRSMYRSLRALGVSHFEYHAYVTPPKGRAATTLRVRADATYCFSVDTCPGYEDDDYDGPPRISHVLAFTAVRGRYVITRIGRAPQPSHLQPTPWEDDDLVFAQGRRVTVAAPRRAARNLNAVVALADRAAAVNDRFARYVGNPQRRYRVYLADEKAWRSWYGGQRNDWIIGYEIPLNDAGGDIVLRASRHSSRRELLNTLQHEMGHVVTLTGEYRGGDGGDRWLREGIAEYIGWYPKRAMASLRRPAVHAAVHGGRRPTTIAAKPLPNSAGPRAGNAFYGLGHFAVDCLAEKFGERELFDFVRLRLRADNTLDQASRDAFGTSFKAVDKACVAWIRRRA